MNSYNRRISWDKLKLDIAEHLPGKRKTRERCAALILHGALDLVNGDDQDHDDKTKVDEAPIRYSKISRRCKRFHSTGHELWG